MGGGGFLLLASQVLDLLLLQTEDRASAVAVLWAAVLPSSH